MSDMPGTYSANESSTHSTTYGATEFFSSDQAVDHSKFDLSEFIEWIVQKGGLTQCIVIASLIAVLLCICTGMCITCCRRKRSPYKDPNKQEHDSDTSSSEGEEVPQATNELQIFRHYQPLPTDIDTDVENDHIQTTNENENESDAVVCISFPTALTIDECTTTEHIVAVSKEKVEHKTDIDSSSRSSELFDRCPGPSTTPGSQRTTSTGYTHAMGTASLHGSVAAATMTPRGSTELQRFQYGNYNPANNAHLSNQIHQTPGYFNTFHGAYPDLPDLPPPPPGPDNDDEKHIQGEVEPKASWKYTWNAIKLSEWVGSRGEKYQPYVQGFVDHGINGLSLHRYGKDQAELSKVFGKVVSDDFHRYKLVTDWIALD
eukprot:279551_1